MREVGERAAVGRTAGLKRGRRNHHGSDEAAAEQHDAHDQRRRAQQFLGVANPSERRVFGVGAVAADERHHRDAGLEPREAERELRKHEQRHRGHHHGMAVLLEQRRLPCVEQVGTRGDRLQPVHDQHDVEHEIHGDQADRQRDRVAESLQEDSAEDEQQRHRHRHRMAEPRRHQRVLDEVRRSVGRGQRDRDHEARRGEAEQAEHDDLALPSREEVLEHQDAALPVRAHLGDAVVHRQRAEERQQHEDERGDRRERAGGDERDAGLVGQRRKIVDAGQAHHLPPGGGVRRPNLLAVEIFMPFRTASRGRAASRKIAPMRNLHQDGER